PERPDAPPPVLDREVERAAPGRLDDDVQVDPLRVPPGLLDAPLEPALLALAPEGPGAEEAEAAPNGGRGRGEEVEREDQDEGERQGLDVAPLRERDE